ncbi:signal recognition particle-docking protein FtsY [Herbaspirillum sp. VT-16-41]|uniref:signal recognition particle-docking protein FtsY n=1 Tax=Herbaspirillum sp. VT-16-41 TaxID=1953765 RepID=UPI00098260B6|nr:signal recognition particle-docking protein FtsY [Herbaspirillum sp. VT-16-41]ONN66792.1 signal recognition particle-docking protein FtsY [Herbaspirillum sp. VT-16-41]
MFSFFKRKPKPEAQPALPPQPEAAPQPAPTPVEPVPAAPVSPAAPVATAPMVSAPAVAPVAASTAAPAPPVLPEAVAPVEDAAEEEAEIVAAPEPEPEVKRSWLSRLKAGLSKTSSNLTTLFVGARIDDDLYEELESALLVSDAGVEATQWLLDELKKKVKAERLTEAAQVRTALRTLLIDLLQPLQRPLVLGREKPLVMMIAGVNGAGKTTTIGKLALHLQAHGQSVLLAAGDTFRAAAREQLAIWGERNNVQVIAQESGDPAAVAYDSVHSAQARGTHVVMVDTAGRLPTQLHLMDELKKIKRVIAKAMSSAPHEVLLVIDGNTGQNALAQVKAFDDALGLTGLVVTKLDGTAKGGILAAIAKTRPVPLYFIGVGEKIEDLQPFNATEFVDALLS